MGYDKGIDFTNTNLPDIIELKDINMSYDGGKSYIIKDLNFLVEDKPNQGQFVVILGLSGCGKCVAEGTWIRTSEGIRLIEDIIPKQKEGLLPINNLYVKVANEDMPVQFTYYGGYKETIILKTKDGDILEGRKTHPVKVWDNKTFSFKYKVLKDIKKGDFLVKDDKIQVSFQKSKKAQKLPIFEDNHCKNRKKAKKLYESLKSTYRVAIAMGCSQMGAYRMINDRYRDRTHLKCPRYMTKEIAYYLGLIMGDGSVSGEFSITNMDNEIISFVKNFHKKVFGVGTRVDEKKGTDAVILRPKNRDHVHTWIRLVIGKGYTSDTKVVPEVIRVSSFTYQLSFLRGLFDADGYGTIINKRVEISLNSMPLILFVVNMLGSLSIGYTWNKKAKSHSISLRRSLNWDILFNLDRKKPQYTERVEYQSHYDIIPGSRRVINSAKKRFIFNRAEYDEMGLSALYSKKDLQRGAYLRCKKVIEKKGVILPDIPNFRFVEVVERSKSKNYVYDLSVPSIEEYVANGYVVHNSTVLRFICGLQNPTSGQILIKGKPKEKDFRIGMVFQQYSSFPWLSVLDNVALGLKYKGVSEKNRHEKAMEIIKLVGLDGHEKKYSKYPTLSGGQLQRVAIARSLVADPEILLMDEPFGALDLNTRLQMQDLLCEIWTKLQSTIIFVTHDLPEAVYLGDDVYIMRACPGMIVEKIKVDLPLNRDRNIKRTPRFTNLVNTIENRMIDIQNFMDLEKKS